MSDVSPSSGSIETRAEETQDSEGQENPAAVWELWNESLELAAKEEEEWRKHAKNTIDTYTMEEKEENKQSKFNILYSNTETIVPAIYNSPPVPDVRRRYSDDDPDAKVVSQVIERCISFSVDTSEFDNIIKASVFDAELPGRGVCRVQYEPMMGPPDPATGMTPIAYQRLYLQHIQWDDYRHGPAKSREGVPWEAYRHRMTREQLVKLNPQVGQLVKLDCNVEGYNPDKSDFPPDLFKRAEVWEIWDKEARKVLFIALGYKEGPLATMDPPCQLEGFFPSPKPLQAVFRTDSLVPIEPYRLYKAQADELDIITRRITKLVKVLRWRGVRAKALGDAFDKIKDLDDGQLAPAENALEVTQGQQGIDKFIWMMPIEKLVVVIKELVDQRERIKQVIYEITGIADIMRGSTDAGETLGAQQIKAQWGTLRIQDMQKAAQVYVRDIFRIMAEIIAEKFTPEVIFMMTGIQLTPQQDALMKNDVLRQYRIDVETDSTIRADLNRSQQNISNFISGLAQFGTAMLPLVQAGMPPEIAITMLVSFTRTFKLGREVEDALEMWKQQIMGAAAMAQGAPPPQPGMPASPSGMPGQAPAGAVPQSPTAASASAPAQTPPQEIRITSGDQQVVVQQVTEAMGAIMAQSGQALAAMMQQTTQQNAQLMSAVVQALNAPKEVVRDASGRAVGTRTVMH